MGTTPYLLFRLHGSVYGIPAASVREIQRLPELTPIEEAPACIAGVFNLRGRIVPVTDLLTRFGHPPRPYTLDDAVIVFEAKGGLHGVIASEAVEVKEVAPAEIEKSPGAAKGRPHPRFLEGEARSGEDLVMLLDMAALAEHAEGVDEGADPGDVGISAVPFCPDASAGARAEFRRRAAGLRTEPVPAGAAGALTLAAVTLGGEYYGVGLEAVSEFIGVRNPAPVPCAPAHIAGVMNLAGNIVTLLDLRPLLGLAVGAIPAKAVVLRSGGPGVLVDEVMEVFSLLPSALSPAPAVAAPGSVAGRLVKGVAGYLGRAITILDLIEITSMEDVIVDKEP
ncbi:MAG: chemotaxis protein CheW [Deltaproteobacteria bacterium]|nr:chemotaxis protein CheW [Deltaproteobacteria bacterium]